MKVRIIKQHEDSGGGWRIHFVVEESEDAPASGDVLSIGFRENPELENKVYDVEFTPAKEEAATEEAAPTAEAAETEESSPEEAPAG